MSLFTLLDDLALLLDDVAAMTKVATKRTAGVLADDLAVNAEQVSGVNPDRELPVVWAVAKGSALNKALIVPAVLAISVVAPWAITPILMLGGAFLCYEGVEKLAHRFLHPKEEDEARHGELVKALADPKIDLVAFEKEKVKGAIRTDFILSAEIMVISLGTFDVAAGLGTKVAGLVAIAVIMTVGVYGFVAGIVKLDDLGVALTKRASSAAQAVGRGILWFAPWLMKFLSYGGTVAMLLVGGGILVHGVPQLHHLAVGLEAKGGVVGFVAPAVVNGLVGLVAGAVVVGILTVGKKMLPKRDAAVAADGADEPE